MAHEVDKGVVQAIRDGPKSTTSLSAWGDGDSDTDESSTNDKEEEKLKTRSKQRKNSKKEEKGMPQRVDNAGNEETTSRESGEEYAMEDDNEGKKTNGKKRAATRRAGKNSVALLKEAKDQMQADVDTK